MVGGIGVKEENHRVRHDVLRLKGEGDQITKAHSRLESIFAVGVQTQLGEPGKIVEHPFHFVGGRVLLRRFCGDVYALPFEEEHVACLSGIAGLAASKQLLTLHGFDDNSEPRTCLSYRADWDAAFSGGQTIVDNGDDSRLPRLGCTADDIDHARLELNDTRRMTGLGPKDEF